MKKTKLKSVNIRKVEKHYGLLKFVKNGHSYDY